MAFSEQERTDIQKYFGAFPEELEPQMFREAARKARAKYHPDKFEHFGDETIREMATERFQQIEALVAKVEAFLEKKIPFEGGVPGPINGVGRFAITRLKIEIITADKELKYDLFGTWYKWLLMGDRFTIPGTQATLVVEESHRGSQIGFQESIRMFLTFGEEDPPEKITDWLFDHIRDRAEAILVGGERLPVDRATVNGMIRRMAELGSG